MFLIVNYCIEILGGFVGCRYVVVILSKSSTIIHFSQISYTFTSCSVICYRCCCCTSKYSSFLSFSAKLAMSATQLQGIKDRSVQFATCVEVEVLCWGFGRIVVQYQSPVHYVPTTPQKFLCSNLLKVNETFFIIPTGVI